MTQTTERPAGRTAWLGLGVLALAALLVSIDLFVLLLALPGLSVELDASATEQLWITDVYSFMIAGFLITMGALGDRVGRRRLLLIGAAAFGAASVLAAYSTTPEMLIAARGLLGIAGATLAPSTLALISNMFPVPKQRGLAIGVWLACFVGGAAAGPLVGGVLLEHFWWGSVFLIGTPAMVLLLAVGPFLLPEFKAAKPGRLDLVSVGLSLAAVLPAVYGLKEFARAGWDAGPAIAVLIGLAVGVVFIRRQRVLSDPLLDLRLFTRGSFSAALGGMFAGTFTMGALMVFSAQYLQLVHGLSPLRAGLCMIPAMVASGVSFLLGPLLARRFRPAYLIGGGLLVSVAGLLLVASADAGSGLPAVAVGFAVTNLGAGPLVTLSTDLIVGSVPPERAGVAGSLTETGGEFGFALGIAVLGSLVTAVYRSRLSVPDGVSPGRAGGARESLASAGDVATGLPTGVREALLDSARGAFTTGMQVAAVTAALLLMIVAGVVVALLRHVPPTGHLSADASATEPVR